MTFQIQFQNRALQDVIKITKSGNKSDINKLNSILDELKITPYSGIGHPEPLKHQLSGYWSRRLDQKDRIIYQVIEYPEGAVVIVSALGHY